MAQPLFELTLVRPWHWGIALVGLPDANVPDVTQAGPVSVGSECVVLHVRHAQDVDSDRFEGEWEWATSTIVIRSLLEPDVHQREILADLEVETADEVLSIGDADGEIRLPTPGTRTRILVSTTEASSSMDDVWVDLIAVVRP